MLLYTIQTIFIYNTFHFYTTSIYLISHHYCPVKITGIDC